MLSPVDPVNAAVNSACAHFNACAAVVQQDGRTHVHDGHALQMLLPARAWPAYCDHVGTPTTLACGSLKLQIKGSKPAPMDVCTRSAHAAAQAKLKLRVPGLI